MCTLSDGGYGYGECEMPNTMLVEDTSGDGSGTTSNITRAEMPGPCLCEGKVNSGLTVSRKYRVGQVAVEEVLHTIYYLVTYE